MALKKGDKIIRNFVNKYSNRFVSRWLILIFDLIGVGVAFILAYLLRINFNFDSTYVKDLLIHGPYIMGLYFIFFLITGSYKGIIRHTSGKDVNRVMLAASLALVTNTLITILARNTELEFLPKLPHSIALIHFLLVAFSLLSSRFLVKVLYRSLSSKVVENKIEVLIYGVSDRSQRVAQMFATKFGAYNVNGFISTDSRSIGQTMLGLKCFNLDQAKDWIASKKINELILGEELPNEERKLIYNLCLEHRVKIKNVPPIDQWIEGNIQASQLKQVTIEDLLGRSEVQIRQDHIASEINDKTILVTGAAGSIGSEIVRQLLKFKPRTILLLDNSETGIHQLVLELSIKFKNQNVGLDAIIGDICDNKHLNQIFETHKVQVLYHAAAYKHVPLMESQPHQAVKVNLLATYNLAAIASKYKVSKFVFISTDKAVNPSNVMGATKRLAEMALSFNQNIEGNITSFVSVRFGNVLGSNGSVIPLFKKQIEEGGPITITHKEVTRFFMTIPEASQLVLEAGAMGNGSELFLLDMGEPIKIYDLVKKMVHFSGLELNKDIFIKYIGLRPGEKLYEELLTNEENVKPTHNPKICISETNICPKLEFQTFIKNIEVNLMDLTSMELVKRVKEMVPEYKSENSVFSTLD